MSGLHIFLAVILVFVLGVYFFEQTEHETASRAAWQTLGVAAAIGFLTVLGGALWALVLT